MHLRRSSPADVSCGRPSCSISFPGIAFVCAAPHRTPSTILALLATAFISAALVLVVFTNTVQAQPVIVEAARNAALEQLPILFHHGFNDDGRLWAYGPSGGAAGSAAQYWETLEIRTPQGTLVQQGIPTYVVQYWARSNTPAAVEGDPNATADDGWAALKSPEQIRTSGQNYNSPDPIGYFMENSGALFEVIPDCEFTGTGVSCTYPAAVFLAELESRKITSNYNRNGLVLHHSRDLADLFEHVFVTDSRFAGLRQVNMITHSAGGLDTRATLHRLNESDDPQVRETVANVIYTAPPFGGSTAAVFAARLYEPVIDATIFQDPWLRGGAGPLTLSELFVALARSFVNPTAEAAVEILIEATPKPFGFDPTAVTIEQLASDPQLANAAVLFIIALRDLVTGLIGFPGEPKVSQDLTPWSAVENLNNYQPNFHTKQFVTWGEGGGGINLTPSLAAARAAYTADGSCCNEFLDPSTLDRLNDDWALSHVSARMLATAAGGMEELRGYADLWHGNINTDMATVGMDWVSTLITPVTSLELTGPVPTADASWRYYLVGPATSARFTPETRTVEDRFGDVATIAAAAVEYRIVTYDIDGVPAYHDWTEVAAGATVSFGDLAAGEGAGAGADLSGERPFRLEWRAVSEAGSKEPIRSATFVIDDTPPSVALIDVFTPGIEDSPEIMGAGLLTPRGRFRRSDLITSRSDLANLSRMIGRQETDWIIRNPSNKLLRIDFDEPQAIVRYQWDEFFTDPVTTSLPNVSLSFPLADLEPGPHTLYFEVSDALGNTTNAVRSVSILVDDQAPVVGLNYEPTGGLGFIVGPDTPLEFVAEDVETGVVTGELFVPGLDPVPVNSNFRMGETTIAEGAQGTGVLGTIVTLQADVSDGVGNRRQQSFDVYYDFSAPRIELQHVDNGVLTTDGTYRTTESVVRVEVRVTDNAGYQLPTWTAARPGTDQLRSGAPFTYEARDGRAAANGGNVPLFDGTNVIVVTVADLVGNTSSIQINIEKVQTLIEDESNRPIELLSLHVDGGTTGGTGPQNVGVSDDGSVFIFDSSRRDHVDDDTNDLRDIFVWRNSNVTRANTTASGEQALGGDSRNPALSGNGRFAYFASEATNLAGESTSGVNLYVKDLNTGRIALVTRDLDGDPINLNSLFGRLSFLRISATQSGRYVFFDDRFNAYIEGDTNGNLDVFVADLDPDVDGDFFNTPPVIRRVSVAPDGSEGVGGGNTRGSRYPSASRDGLFVAFQTDHENLFEGDDNGSADAVLARFGGVDAQGTIDFSSITILPLGVDDQGNVTQWGSEHPTIDRTGRSVVFTTAANLLGSDTNNEGVDSDVYRSTGFIENWKNRVLAFVSASGGGDAVSGRIAPNHAPSISDYTADGDPRTAYLADKTALVQGDLNGSVDLFVHADDLEAVNWLSPTIPSTLSVREGGITPDGGYAWWVTVEEYSDVIGAGTGLDLYRRRIDPEAESEAPTIVTSPADATALLGEDVAFSVAAAGRPAPAYQWTFNGEDLPGATNPTLFLSGVSLGDRGAYAVRVSNEAGTVESGAARLSVTSLVPAFMVQPESIEVAEGGTAEFAAEVVGLTPLEFQWRRNGIDLTDDDRIAGSATDTLRIFSTDPADAGTYTLTASNPGGTAQSDAVELTVLPSTSAEGLGAVPSSFALDQNYPNPFNPTTTIRFALPQQEHVRIEVFDALGRRVLVLVDDVAAAGFHAVTLDASRLASGAYFYVMSAGSFQHARPFLLAK